MDINVIDFGTLPDGQKISSFELKNDFGASVSIINYGGIVRSICTLDKHGNSGDIVLGFDNLANYLAPHPYFGAIIGRYANRIGKASFSIDGKVYRLAANKGPNHLHGGLKGFDKKVWLAVKNFSTEFVSLKLGLESEDGDEGYPGNLLVETEYILNNQNELVINYSAQTDKSTHINLTNHSYFNLNACQGKIYDHVLQINAETITKVDDTQIPTGELMPVSGGPFDFLTPKPIGKDIESISPGYDHNFVVKGYDGHVRNIAKISDPLSGRTMEVDTSEPGVQLYTTNSRDEIKGKEGKIYGMHSAFCLETQHFPDSPNKNSFPPTILHPGEVYRSTTIYRFGIRQ
ncbi:MAG: galactose mutarotase [Bacteroidales bacterium]|nr:galactose mutarotase [Bacteroidales bacterium]MCB9013889.1 galactose mutarotase [Bacteroidales bacterium]